MLIHEDEHKSAHVFPLRQLALPEHVHCLGHLHLVAVIKAIGHTVHCFRLLRIDALVLLAVSLQANDARLNLNDHKRTLGVFAEQINGRGGAVREVGHGHLGAHDAPVARAEVCYTGLHACAGTDWYMGKNE